MSTDISTEKDIEVASDSLSPSATVAVTLADSSSTSDLVSHPSESVDLNNSNTPSVELDLSGNLSGLSASPDDMTSTAAASTSAAAAAAASASTSVSTESVRVSREYEGEHPSTHLAQVSDHDTAHHTLTHTSFTPTQITTLDKCSPYLPDSVSTQNLSSSSPQLMLQRCYELFVFLDKDNDHRLSEEEFRIGLQVFSKLFPVQVTQAHEIMQIVGGASSLPTPDPNDPCTTANLPTLAAATSNTNSHNHSASPSPSTSTPSSTLSSSSSTSPPVTSLSFSEFYSFYSSLLTHACFTSKDLHHLDFRELKRKLESQGINPSKSQIENMLLLNDLFKTYDLRGSLEYMPFLKLFIHTTTLNESVAHSSLFLHSWFNAGRNSTPYNKPIEISPVQDFMAGTSAGIFLTIVGHPFDTIKVRMQTDPIFRSGIDCLLKTVSSEGIFALYKGMASPMMTIPLVNAVVFWAYARAKDFLHARQKVKEPLSLWEISLCGGWAGFVNCFIVSPVELIKTRLQIQYESNIPHSYSADLQYEKKMPKTTPPKYVQFSPLKNIYKYAETYSQAHPSASLNGKQGIVTYRHKLSAASLPTIPSPVNHLAQQAMQPPNTNNGAGFSTASVRKLSFMTAHTSPYAKFSTSAPVNPAVPASSAPINVNPNSTSESFSGVFDCIQKIYAQNGIKGLYRGMAATVYREIPGYSGQYFAYEALKRGMTKPGEKTSDLGALPLILAGGSAGIFGWVVSYPMDYIKSQLQAEAYDRKTAFPKNPYLFDGGFFSCMQSTVQRDGWRGLWRGFGPCIARAFPANAAGFLAYEFTLKKLRDWDE